MVVELSLAVAAGASHAGVSTVEEVVLGACVGGTEATDPVAFASGLGVEGTELDVGSAFEGGVLLVLAATTALNGAVRHAAPIAARPSQA